MKDILRIPKLVLDVYRYEETMEIDYSAVSVVSVFFGAMLYMANFNNVNNLRVVLVAYLAGTLLISMPFILARINQKKKYILGCLIVLIVMLTIFMLYGVNDGATNYWAFLFAFASLIIVGMPVGLGICTYFMVFTVVIFWTPIRDILPYKYERTYAVLFPLIYMFAFGTTFVANLFIKSYRMEHEKQEEQLKFELKDAIWEVEQAMVDSVANVSRVIDEKDIYTKEHSLRVANYSKLIAERYGVSPKNNKLDAIYNAALLHDIGKIAVPDHILKKGQGLSDEEYEIMKKHTEWGQTILAEMEFITDADLGAKFHHEWMDGTGYPGGVKGNDIPLIGRIVSVADTLDAMNSERVYRKPCSREHILNTFEQGKGTQFDARLASIVCELIQEGKIKILADEQ